MLRRFFQAVACWFGGFLIAFGDYIYRGIHFQTILLHQHHRAADFAFILRMICFFGLTSLHFAWPTLLLLLPAYLWRDGSFLLRYWFVFAGLGAAAGALIAYFLLSATPHNSIPPIYRPIFVPRAAISGGSAFLLGWLLLRWPRKRI